MRAIFLCVLIASLCVDVTKAVCLSCLQLCDAVDGPQTVAEYKLQANGTVLCQCKMNGQILDLPNLGFKTCMGTFQSGESQMADFCCSSCRNGTACPTTTAGNSVAVAVDVSFSSDAGCCEYYDVAGGEAVQPSSMGIFAKVSGLTSSNLPVYKNSDGMYLYYGATEYGFTAWGIGANYSGIGQSVMANAGGAVCPAAATGYQASTANGGWTSYDMSVSCTQGCCEYYDVAGGEAVQPSSMGIFAKASGLTSSNLPVYKNSDGMYLYYGATEYGFTAWGIGANYSGIGQSVMANAGGAVCPAAATGYQASTANGGWTSYDMSVSCTQGCCEYYDVAGGEAVQPSSMGIFAKASGLTSSNLPVYKNSDGMYLYYGATEYGFTAWGIGANYSGIGQSVMANAGGAVCPAAATGYQASTAYGGWTSYDMSVNCTQGTRYVNGTTTTGDVHVYMHLITCQAIKKAYKNQQCCKNPDADFQLAPAAGNSTSYTFTCQAIKEAYKNQQCCTKPYADFQLPAAGTRRAKEPKGMGADWVRKLETLSVLHKQGLMTNQDFQAAKMRLVDTVVG